MKIIHRSVILRILRICTRCRINNKMNDSETISNKVAEFAGPNPNNKLTEPIFKIKRFQLYYRISGTEKIIKRYHIKILIKVY